MNSRSDPIKVTREWTNSLNCNARVRVRLCARALLRLCTNRMARGAIYVRVCSIQFGEFARMVPATVA